MIIEDDPSSISALENATGKEDFFESMVEGYKEHITIPRFRKLWKFAEENDREEVKEACHTFFHEQRVENKSQLFKQWPIGEFPAIIRQSIKRLLEVVSI